MSSLGTIVLALSQLPGLNGPRLSPTEWFIRTWNDGGWMMWPLGASGLLGLIIIVWKLVELSLKGVRTRKFLQEVDAMLAERRVDDALELSRASTAPAARILAAGLERRREGTERVRQAIENVGLFEMAALERGLIWLATVSNVAPLLGFLGTVIGMIAAFAAIEAAGEVDAQLVAGGIKIALITTAAGLIIAIPVNIAHNYFVSRIDGMVVDMEESAQKMIDALHDLEVGSSTV
ncbi:MAG TPA: MotA/TolQ/ExbB proton channel family protein [Longimicrobiales bacterium]